MASPGEAAAVRFLDGEEMIVSIGYNTLKLFAKDGRRSLATIAFTDILPNWGDCDQTVTAGLKELLLMAAVNEAAECLTRREAVARITADKLRWSVTTVVRKLGGDPEA